MSYYNTEEPEDEGGGGGEFDYGGVVEISAEEKISFIDQNDSVFYQNQKKIRDNEKEDLATRGEAIYALGPIYHDTSGHLYHPISGKIWELTQCKLCLQSGKKTEEVWPGTPESEKGWICWHDTYHFNGVPWGICVDFDEKKQQYQMHGSTFCSPNCVRAYLLERNFERKHVSLTYRFMYSVMMLKKDEPLFAAKPAHVLKRFLPKTGVTIEEFRENFLTSQVTVLPPKMISVVTLIEEIKYRREHNNVLIKRKELQKRRKTEQKENSKRRRKQNDGGKKTEELIYNNITKPNSMMKAMFLKARSSNK